MSSRGLFLILVTVLAAACADGAERASYLAQTTERCPAVDAMAAQRSTQPLPADFRPVSVIRCTFALTDFGSATSPRSDFTWTAAQRSTGPFDNLVDALRVQPQRSDGKPVCPAVLLSPVLVRPCREPAHAATVLLAELGNPAAAALRELPAAPDPPACSAAGTPAGDRQEQNGPRPGDPAATAARSGTAHRRPTNVPQRSQPHSPTAVRPRHDGAPPGTRTPNPRIKRT
jgi:hypothetical protein